MPLIRFYFVLSWLVVGLGALIAARIFTRYEDAAGRRWPLTLACGALLLVQIESLTIWASWQAPLGHIVLRTAPLLGVVLLLFAWRTGPGTGTRRRIAVGALGLLTAALMALTFTAPERTGAALLLGAVAGAGVALGSATTWLTFRDSVVIFPGIALIVLLTNTLPGVERPRLAALVATSLLNLHWAVVLWRATSDRPALEAHLALVRRRYETTPLPAEVAAQIRRALDDAMETRRAFLDPDLGLTALADRLGCAPHHLSQVLNRELGVNFNEYVNARRIRHACALLDGDASATVLSVAYESGFNNKSTFNAAFKKVTGTTPRDYRSRGAVHRA